MKIFNSLYQLNVFAKSSILDEWWEDPLSVEIERTTVILQYHITSYLSNQYFNYLFIIAYV